GIYMATATNMLNCLVPITQFNKGQASRIFDRLRTEKQLVVLKNNVIRTFNLLQFLSIENNRLKYLIIVSSYFRKLINIHSAVTSVWECKSF
ncbi:MAG: hypothetical protein IIV41_10835, partial [Akkermansia sp.]|nr:hypothetical protein [Akkermansia sp.]